MQEVSKMNRLINELGVNVEYVNKRLDEPALFLPDVNLILVDATQDEYTQQKALLHELGHAAKHKDITCLYEATNTTHSKMEREANEFMVQEVVSEYLATTSISASEINWADFAKTHGLDCELVYRALKKEQA